MASAPVASGAQPAAAPVRELAPEHGRLPPGPRMPALAQTLAWAFAPTWLMDRCARRLGEAFTLTFWPSGIQLVMFSEREAVKTVFTAPPEVAPSAARLLARGAGGRARAPCSC